MGEREEEREAFRNGSSPIRNIKDGKCGFTQNLCNEIYSVWKQHDGLQLSKMENKDNKKQCKSKFCQHVAKTIITLIPPTRVPPIADGESESCAYLIWGEKYVTDNFWGVENKHSTALKSHILT